ncbi:MAG: hypothetical protein QOI31_782 [Solirubrobacterales bacterium]|nr:hypothetical protein [Solirubrobacterales bacterium]
MRKPTRVAGGLFRRAIAAALAISLLAGGTIAEAKIERLKSKQKEVGAGEQASQKLKCPNGMHVLSGGVYTTGSSLEDEVAGSAPFDGPDSDKKADDGWRGAINAGPAAKQMRTYATCSNSVDATYKRADFAFGGNFEAEKTQVDCPDGTEPIGGGLTVAGKSTERPLATSNRIFSPSSFSLWESGLRTLAAGTAVAHAICSDDPGLSVASGGGSVGPHAQTDYAASCPAGTTAIGGGGTYGPGDDGGEALELASLLPSDGDDADGKADDGWTTWFNNEHASNSVIGYVSAICVE